MIYYEDAQTFPTALDVFRSCNYYSQLIAANVMFLQGKLDRTPYHGGSVDEETLPLLDELIEINQLGFLSVCGQPALIHTFFSDRTHKWISEEQRPFLEGYLPKSLVPQFIKYMETQTEYMYHMYELIPPSFLFRWFNPERLTIRCIWTSAPEALNVTRDKAHTQLEGLESEPWHYYTNIYRDVQGYDFEGFRNIFPILVPHTVKIVLMGKTYGQGSTEVVMLDFLHQHGSYSMVKEMDDAIDASKSVN